MCHFCCFMIIIWNSVFENQLKCNHYALFSISSNSWKRQLSNWVCPTLNSQLLPLNPAEHIKHNELVYRDEREKMPEGQRCGFHSSFHYWLLVWSGISYQSLLLLIHSLLHKQTRINQPKGSQNRSFLALAFYVPMTYFPSSAPRIVTWWQLFLL